MVNVLDFIAVIFATGAIIDVWHNGSIFATARAIVQAKQDIAKHGSITALWTELLTCPFCKSYHIPFYLYLALFGADYFGGIASALIRVMLYSLAATRISNLIDGFVPKGMKYDREQNL